MKKSIYLDYAASAPIVKEVLVEMSRIEQEIYGNPSSLHQKGREAFLLIEKSRQKIAGIFSSSPEEIYFTSGGTESCNLAILGYARAQKKGSHIITTAFEHHAVLNPLKQLEFEGYKVTYLKPSPEGFVEAEKIKKAIKAETVLVTAMYANNEIGTIQPVIEIGKLIAAENKHRRSQGKKQIVFHTDACQAAGYLDLNVQTLGVDLMSINGSKIGGPKGAGVLFIKKGINLKPLVYGGGQESNIRSGTENTVGIVGLAKALELAQGSKSKNYAKVSELRNWLFKNILKEIPKSYINGSLENRLPNNLNLRFEGVEGEMLMLYLDAKGIFISTGSACSTSETLLSHVLKSIGLSDREARSSIRITMGKETTKSDLKYFVSVLKSNVELIRKSKNSFFID